MGAAPEVSEVARLRRERDLYLRLLGIGAHTEIEPFLKEALSLIVEATGARHGYLELHDERSEGAEPRWSTAHGFSSDQAKDIRSRVSHGIIAETLASGQTVDTPSALLDQRFAGRPSVRLGRIESVLCVPIGGDPPIGVLYLQGREPSGPFAPEDRARAETCARHIAPLADNLLVRQRVKETNDPTRPYRNRLHLDGVAGSSPALAALLHDVALAAPPDINVLLTGETGTGKSHIARVIHDNGPRVGQPFVEVNCAALPEGLLESELFGALPGGHSTATRRIEGKIAVAQGGTVFLDEIGVLPLSAQSKLLQLLQSKRYYPLGSATPVLADVRVIAATNLDLDAAVADGRFREDLFYRLHVLRIRVPSLAERRSDIPELANHFCAAACERHRLQRLELSGEALRAAQAAEWPGNVRQLANAVETAAIRAAGVGATRVERAHLFPDRVAERTELGASLTFQEETRRFQADLLRETLEANDWNISQTARQLDLARSHVYNLLKAFGLKSKGG